MKNLFQISEEEKRRILKLHESATKRNYLLFEQEVSTADTYTYYAVTFEPYVDPSRKKEESTELTFYAAESSDGKFYRAEVKDKDADGKPISFTVNTQFTLPKMSDGNNELNELTYSYTGDNNYKPKEGQTKNAYVGEYPLPDGGGVAKRDFFLVEFVTGGGSYPALLAVYGENMRGNSYGFVDLVQMGEDIVVNKIALRLKKGIGGMIAGSPFPGYPIPEATLPKDKGNTPQIVSLSVSSDNIEMFDFNSIVPTEAASKVINKFINQIVKIRQDYGNDVFIDLLNHLKNSELVVTGWASIDGDPNERVPVNKLNGCGGGTRHDYNQCLSEKRAKAIADKINSIFQSKGWPASFKFVGKGETDEFNGKGWKKDQNPQPTTQETLPNRRFTISVPEYKRTIKKV